MKLNLTLIILFFTNLILAQVNSNYHYVEGYTRSDGTYVKGHYRTDPNHTNTDNYSTLGNTNPWTGQPGWITPDNNYTSFDTYSSEALKSFSTISTNLDNYSINTTSYGSYNVNNSETFNDVFERYNIKPINETNLISTVKLELPSINMNQKAIQYHYKYDLYYRKMLESSLFLIGYDYGIVDGIIDNQTVEAIKEFQRNEGLSVDGMLGPQSIARMIIRLEGHY